MKRILLIHTGGTIGSSQSQEKSIREQNSQTVKKAKKHLIAAFEQSQSAYAEEVEIIDSQFSDHATTLSESMTPQKLSNIIGFIIEKLSGKEKFDGVILLHGTDTLAYTSAIFSFIFAEISIPMFLVSGNRPPADPKSNASANFIAAVDLICGGIAPNVYITYRNAGSKMRLFLGSGIMQCPNFSEDFTSAADSKVFILNEYNTAEALKMCCRYSEKRMAYPAVDISKFSKLTDRALLIRPYTGLDYSVFEGCLSKNSTSSYKGVVHGTYHSGTVSLPGLVLLTEAEQLEKSGDFNKASEYKQKAFEEMKSSKSVIYLADLCKKNNIPLYIAPSALGINQYETMAVVSRETDAVLLNMTIEAAYAKLLVALSYNLTTEETDNYMRADINGEWCV